MGNKKNTKGRYIRKIGFVDIYAKDTYRKEKNRGKNSPPPSVETTEIIIYQGKEKIESGIKNIEVAIEKAIAHMGDSYSGYIK